MALLAPFMTLSARQSPRPPTGDRYCINSCPPLFFDVEIAPEHLGCQAEALLWVTVAPGQLEEVANATARHPHVALAAATSGATNPLRFAAVPLLPVGGRERQPHRVHEPPGRVVAKPGEAALQVGDLLLGRAERS